MPNKISVVVIAILVGIIIVMALGFSYLQNEINNLKPATNNPTSTALPTSSPSSIGTSPSPSPTTQTTSYTYTVFEWYVRNEYINNVSWLDSIGPYDSSKSWTENYRSLISSNGGSAFPAQAHDSLAAVYLTVPAFVSVEFNERTGWTKATYKYFEQDGEPYLYTVETSLFYFVKNSDLYGWKEYFT